MGGGSKKRKEAKEAEQAQKAAKGVKGCGEGGGEVGSKKKLSKKEEQAQKREAKKQERETRSEFRREKFRKMYGKEEWDAEFKKFLKKLLPLGYFVREVTGDGNCFFRSIADQLEIEDVDHVEVRRRIVQHIIENRPNFEPFIEDDVPFDRYVVEMAKNGTWGGNLELQACSMVFSVNVKIFQVDLPCWDVVNWPPTAKTLFLSYHDGDHWNSVRPLATLTEKEATKISSLLGVKILSGSNPEEIAAKMREEYGDVETAIPQPVKAEPTKAERIIMENTGETDLDKIRAMLVAFDDDTDAVISEIYRIRYEEDGDGDGGDTYNEYGNNGGSGNSDGKSGTKEYVILSLNSNDDDCGKKKSSISDTGKKRRMTKKQLKEQKKAQKRNQKGMGIDDPDVKIISVNGGGDALIPSQKI